MVEQCNKFELLAIYLNPRFGNIYEYNMAGGDVGYDIQEWTDELRAAVRAYLLHDLPPPLPVACLIPMTQNR
ncbi:hypothetical protein [Nocardia brasiliensis]|uniref:hypothetical protein n=1 Tax=Nocardia brasiliensis TaxID=37326 RepID=UPI003D900FC8